MLSLSPTPFCHFLSHFLCTFCKQIGKDTKLHTRKKKKGRLFDTFSPLVFFLFLFNSLPFQLESPCCLFSWTSVRALDVFSPRSCFPLHLATWSFFFFRLFHHVARLLQEESIAIEFFPDKCTSSYSPAHIKDTKKKKKHRSLFFISLLHVSYRRGGVGFLLPPASLSGFTY